MFMPMNRKNRSSKIVVRVDQIKELKKASRKKFGRPGQGRKTSHVDRKKKDNKDSCRKWPTGKPDKGDQ